MDFWTLVATHSGAILLGMVIGAAATYWGNLFTDQRRQKERVSDARARFKRLRDEMLALFTEMHDDLAREPHVRDFYITGGFTEGRRQKWFHYLPDAHPDVQNQVTVLEGNGYVDVIEHETCNTYRMREPFVELLLADK